MTTRHLGLALPVVVRPIRDDTMLPNPGPCTTC